MRVPPKKMSIFFPEIFCQHIDRRSQEVSATYVQPLGRDRHWKQVWIKLTPPLRDRVKSIAAIIFPRDIFKAERQKKFQLFCSCWTQNINIKKK